MIIKAVAQAFLDDSGMNAKIAGRIFRAAQVPQGQLKRRVAYTRLSDVSVDTIDAGPTTVRTATYQLDCWGEGATPGEDAETLADLLVKPISDGGFFNGYRGSWSYTEDAVVTTYKVHKCLVRDRRDLQEYPSDGGEKGPQAVSLDVEITYQRTT